MLSNSKQFDKPVKYADHTDGSGPTATPATPESGSTQYGNEAMDGGNAKMEEERRKKARNSGVYSDADTKY